MSNCVFGIRYCSGAFEEKCIKLVKLWYYHIWSAGKVIPCQVMHLSYTVSYDLKIYRSHSFTSSYSVLILYYIYYYSSYIWFISIRFALARNLVSTFSSSQVCTKLYLPARSSYPLCSKAYTYGLRCEVNQH